jgi:hypothetical protein
VEDCIKVNVTIPPESPVTVPVFVTDAIAGLLLIHVPPFTGDKVVVVMAQIEFVPVMLTAGRSLTVAVVVVALQPVDVSVYVKVTVPADIPVTTPALLTEATTGLLLAQVPPVVGDKVAVLFTQTAGMPVTVGSAPTVTADVVLVHDDDARVKVNVADPAATPVTTPAFVTVAIPLLLLTHVPPVVGESVVVLPIQIVEAPVILVTGAFFLVTVVGTEMAEQV